MRLQKVSTSVKYSVFRFYSILQQFGFSPLMLLQSLAALPRYVRQYVDFSSKAKAISGELISNRLSTCRMGLAYPVLTDYRKSAGANSGHYYHQDLYVAKKIHRDCPDMHLDIGSRIDGFVAHLLSFGQKTILGDVRPLIDNDENLSSIIIDLSILPETAVKTQYLSISSLHVVEHVGLGRYGDKVDPAGHIKAIRHLSLLLAKGGVIYLSFPISSQSRIEFNAHRVLSIAEAYAIFAEVGLTVTDFAYVDDHGYLHQLNSLDRIDVVNSYGLHYGCGIWTLTH